MRLRVPAYSTLWFLLNPSRPSQAREDSLFCWNWKPDPQWQQVGQDLEGENAGDLFGHGIAISSDGNRIAVGAANADANGFIDSGLVRVFEWKGTAWDQMGQAIDGKGANERFGHVIAMSADGTRVAIGQAIINESTLTSVRVYDWTGSTWEQVGNDLVGQEVGDWFGKGLDLSADGSRMAVGAPYQDIRLWKEGTVRIFDYNDSTEEWEQVGQTLTGETFEDWGGYNVALSANGSRVAIAEIYGGTDGIVPQYDGQVRVWDLNGNVWQVVGKIRGENFNDRSGHSIAMSADGTRVASGSPWNGGSGSAAGHARVFEWGGGINWEQLGDDIDGDSQGDLLGTTMSMSADGNRFFVGAYRHDSERGHVKVFDWNGTSWIKTGLFITGEAVGDQFGGALAASADGSRVVIGATQNDGVAGNNTGYARVFDLVEENLDV